MWIDYLFGPLDISYCIFFNILSFIGVLFGVLLLILLVIFPKLFKNIKEMFFLLFLYFIIYFQNRIFYDMCVNNNLILEGAVAQINFNTKLLNTSGAEVSKDIVKQLANTSSAWNEKYPEIKNNVMYIQKQLNTIDNNTKPLQYKTVTNIVNA